MGIGGKKVRKGKKGKKGLKSASQSPDGGLTRNATIKGSEIIPDFEQKKNPKKVVGLAPPEKDFAGNNTPPKVTRF